MSLSHMMFVLSGWSVCAVAASGILIGSSVTYAVMKYFEEDRAFNRSITPPKR
jgi:hypothetical protein